MNAPYWLLYTISWLTTTYAVYRLFEKTEDVIKGKSKRKISKWLMNLNFKESYNWGSTFRKLFEMSFTKKHFSWKCFIRSVLCSFVLYVLIALLIYSIAHQNYYFDDDRTNFIFLYFLSCSVFADYISLYETRILIKFLGKTKSVISQIMILIADLVLTSCIFFVVGYLLMNLLMRGMHYCNRYVPFLKFQITQQNMPLKKHFEMFLELFIDDPQMTMTASMPIAFYTTFLTSFWLWGFFLSSLSLKFLNRINMPLIFLKNHLDINRKPIKSIGLVFMLLVTFLYFAFGIYLLFR